MRGLPRLPFLTKCLFLPLRPGPRLSISAPRGTQERPLQEQLIGSGCGGDSAFRLPDGAKLLASGMRAQK